MPSPLRGLVGLLATEDCIASFSRNVVLSPPLLEPIDPAVLDPTVFASYVVVVAMVYDPSSFVDADDLELDCRRSLRDALSLVLKVLDSRVSSSPGSSNIVSGLPQSTGYRREAALVTRAIVGFVRRNCK